MTPLMPSCCAVLKITQTHPAAAGSMLWLITFTLPTFLILKALSQRCLEDPPLGFLLPRFLVTARSTILS